MIYNSEETRANILKGAKLVYETVGTTLGPKGRNVLLRDKFGTFKITHDGVTVARSIKTADLGEIGIGADLLKVASEKMDVIGDGTTSVTVLAYHLMVEANKLIGAGENPMQIKKELDSAVDDLIAQVEKRSKKIGKQFEEVLQVATISAADPELGKVIAELMVKVGYEGVITVETTQGLEIETSVSEGYTFDKGYLSPYFITEESTRSAVIDNPAVIIYNGDVRELNDIASVIEPMFQTNIKGFILIANNVEADALNNLVLNKAKNVLQCVAVKSPYQSEQLQDIATYVGGKVIDPNTGEVPDISYLGRADKVVVREGETTLINGQGAGEDVEARVSELKDQMKTADDVKTAYLTDRIAALRGQVGMIKVGGVTETEAKETKDRVDDAVAAVRAAMEDGIVAGGGVTLRDLNTDNKTIKAALLAPYNTLLENSGIDQPENIVKIWKAGCGIDVATGEEVDMVKVGIIDPARVTKEVIRNAFAVAGIALTVGGSVVDDPVTPEELNRLMQAQ